jgi:hypothetical protein
MSVFDARCAKSVLILAVGLALAGVTAGCRSLIDTQIAMVDGALGCYRPHQPDANGRVSLTHADHRVVTNDPRA